MDLELTWPLDLEERPHGLPESPHAAAFAIEAVVSAQHPGCALKDYASLPVKNGVLYRRSLDVILYVFPTSPLTAKN